MFPVSVNVTFDWLHEGSPTLGLRTSISLWNFLCIYSCAPSLTLLPVLVRSHTALKNCLRLGNLSKGLIDLQFCRAGEASGNLQSWWKGKQAHLTRQQVTERERECEGGRTLYKTIRSCDNSLTVVKTAWGNHPHDPITSLPWHVGIIGPSLNMWRMQFEMRFGWGSRAKPYHCLSSASCQISSGIRFSQGCNP